MTVIIINNHTYTYEIITFIKVVAKNSINNPLYNNVKLNFWGTPFVIIYRLFSKLIFLLKITNYWELLQNSRLVDSIFQVHKIDLKIHTFDIGVTAQNDDSVCSHSFLQVPLFRHSTYCAISGLFWQVSRKTICVEVQ